MFATTINRINPSDIYTCSPEPEEYPKQSQSTTTSIHLLESAQLHDPFCDESLYQITFPLFHSAQIEAEYKERQRKYLNVFHLLPVAILALGVVATRTSVESAFANDADFMVANIIVYSCIIIFSIYFSAHLIKIYYQLTAATDSPYYKLITTFLMSSIGNRLEDAIILLGSIGGGLVLYTRVTKGQCKENINLWQTQTCNPEADSHSIPLDHTMFIYLFPIFAQSAMKAVSIQAALLSWLSSLIFVTSCVIYVKGWHLLWVIWYSLFFLYICFTNERSVRLSFFTIRDIIAVKERNQQLLLLQQQSQHDINEERNRRRLAEVAIAIDRANHDKTLMEEESKQMRSLIGNVAHDLKTPLQSFKMDLDLMSTVLQRLYKMTKTDDTNQTIMKTNSDTTKSNIASSSNNNNIGDIEQNIKSSSIISKDIKTNIILSNSVNLSKDILELDSLITSLNSSCSFMNMAINRGIDFTKASSGINLVPCLSTFNITDALHEPVNCIQHLQPSLDIRIHMNTSSFCPNIISDKHWFMENILCYLSNAVKYGNGSGVDLYIDIIRSNQNNMNDNNNTDSTSKPPTSTSTSMLRVSVEDNGIGVPEEQMKALFKPFKQAQRMAIGGTGLGLYSMTKRMEALQGQCGVSGRGDGQQGSCFWFSFPYRPDNWYETEGGESKSAVNQTLMTLLRHDSFREEIDKDNDDGHDHDHSTDSAPMPMPTLTSTTHGSILLSRTPSVRTRASSKPSFFGQGSRNQFDSLCSQESSEVIEFIVPLHILVVDDSMSILKGVARTLTQHGHTVETATNGAIALELLKKKYVDKSRVFDTVLMDLQMPVMDGIEAMTRYRSFENTEWNKCNDRINEDDNNGIESICIRKRLKIIGMSANSDVVTMNAALEAGADCFLPKPYTYADLEPLLPKSSREK